MGAGEGSTPAKPSKPNSSAQETAATPSYPDWSNSMQAYYGAGSPFYATTVASPSSHPYMWGSQHTLISPYGTPVPYPALYPPGGVYVNPNMAMVPSMGHTNVGLEGKVSNGKDSGTNKKSKGTSRNTGLTGGKGGENGKEASGSANDGATQSADSGSEGSSDASDENNNQGYAAIESKKGSFDQMLEDGANAQNITAGPNLPASVPGNSVERDLWNPSLTDTRAVKMRPNPPGVSPTVAPATLVGREGFMTDQWTRDERELKRQKRKQSNRESARRSRLRKQAECEELQERVDKLNNENRTLRDELQRFSVECEKLTSENNYIKEELSRLCGADAVSKLENNS